MMKAEGFAAVPTWMIRDESVSIYALSTYAALASRSGFESIYPSQAVLAREARCSERRVRDAITELEVLGVVERVKRTSSIGRATDGYVLLQSKRPSARAEVPAAGAASTGRNEQTIPYIEIENIEIENSALTHTQLERAFSAFWSCYPRKVGKPVAERAFARAVKRAGGTTPVLEGARRLRDDPNLPTGDEVRFIPHPSTWLNRDGWEEGPLPGRGGAGGFAGALAAAAEADAHFAALESHGGFALEAGESR